MRSLSLSKQQLLLFGFSRGFSREHDLLFPFDIVRLVCKWMLWTDAWDTAQTSAMIGIEDRRQQKDAIDGHNFMHCIKIRDICAFIDPGDRMFHAFGREVVSIGMKFEWNIKVLHKKESGPAMIGIVDHADVDPFLMDFTDSLCFSYALSDTGRFAMNCTSGTALTVQLDMTRKTVVNEIGAILSFSCENKTLLCKRIDPRRKYRLCIAINGIFDEYAIVPRMFDV
eukprot:CAMPEP_0202688904 /NCGR_PEP_ID=MMETSP1385-20130828/4284_1 /ASSEMBLY_ACC=CAM_ASM_000861 /TAXON_ID=933848 /ORGANISM="Elphidium margaritaceum" /LENGTH=225 /DNA_ID=CAMNT_0049343957 /DNA_START=27 /DNA_END=704 /DNA_ORIENTATION=+